MTRTDYIDLFRRLKRLGKRSLRIENGLNLTALTWQNIPIIEAVRVKHPDYRCDPVSKFVVIAYQITAGFASI